MTKVLIVGLGGFLGAVARYGLTGLVHRRYDSSFPFGTLFVNLSGCFAIGIFLYFAQDRAVFGPSARRFVAIGLLGGFTTFSSFGYETMEVLRDRETMRALWNVAGNVGLSLGAVWLGRTVPGLVGV